MVNVLPLTLLFEKDSGEKESQLELSDLYFLYHFLQKKKITVKKRKQEMNCLYKRLHKVKII